VDHVNEVLKLHWESVVESLVESRQVIVKEDGTVDLSKTKPPQFLETPKDRQSQGAERPQASTKTTPSGLPKRIHNLLIISSPVVRQVLNNFALAVLLPRVI
jgi:hypothetical protein